MKLTPSLPSEGILWVRPETGGQKGLATCQETEKGHMWQQHRREWETRGGGRQACPGRQQEGASALAWKSSGGTDSRGGAGGAVCLAPRKCPARVRESLPWVSPLFSTRAFKRTGKYYSAFSALSWVLHLGGGRRALRNWASNYAPPPSAMISCVQGSQAALSGIIRGQELSWDLGLCA